MAQAVIDAVRSALDSHSPSRVMHEIGTGVPTGMQEGIAETTPALTDTIDTLGETIVSTMEKTATDAVVGFKAEYERIVSETHDTLANLILEITDTTAELPDDMEAVGRDMVDGMISGLNGRSSSLYTTMRRIVSDAIEEAKKAADSHSPSRKTQKLFEDIDEGMIVGAKNKADEVAAALRDVVNRSLDLDIGMDIPSIIANLDDTPPDFSRLTDATSNDNRTYEGDTIVHMHFEGDVVVREEADVHKVAQELNELVQREKRRNGG